MLKILLFVILTPIIGYCQNIITTISFEREANTVISETSEYELYELKISPGYRDNNFKIELIGYDKFGSEIILSRPEIEVKLIVHKKEYKITGSNKYEWDYETEVKSNDIWTDDYIEIGDCSGTKSLLCHLRIKKNESYKINVYAENKLIFEKGLGNE